MKKLFITFCVIMFILFPVFAETVEDTKSLVVKTNVTGTNQIKISETSETTVSGFNTAVAITEAVVTESTLDLDPMYILVKTNRDTFQIKVVAHSMTSSTTSTEIEYSVYSGGDLKVTSTSVGAGAVLADITAESSRMRVLPIEFQIKVLSDVTAVTLNSFQKATAGSYEGTLEINLVSP